MKNNCLLTGPVLFLFLNALVVGCVAQSSTDTNQMINKLSEALKKNYVFEDKAYKMSDMLLVNLSKGKYDNSKSFKDLADELTDDLREVVPDKHLRIQFGSRTPPSNPDPDREYFPHGIAEAKLLEGNIGYFDLRGFSNNSIALRNAVSKAMQILDGSKAIIFDMRKNGGGSPSGVQLFCSYFFPEGSEILLNSLYFRNRDIKNDFYTFDKLDGPRFPETPLYILTSSYTFSGGEEFCYNLQTQKRATLIGETTGGGAHPVDGFSLGHDLTAIIPVGRAINPITGTNWEGVGVTPDVIVNTDSALEKALEMIGN
jgi:hypothetical protein